MSKSKSATVHPVDDRLFVRREESKAAQGGVIIPENVEPTCLRGRIAAMGPGMPTMSGDRMPLAIRHAEKSTLVEVEVGDGVIYSPECATEILMESGKFDIIHFRDALCIIKAG